jgi:methionine-rich copper-binding protein CopC
MFRHLRTTLLLTTLALTPLAALAHARPKVMNPVPDSTIAAPSSVTITFSENLEPKFSSITVTDKAGAQINKQPSRPTGAATLTVALPPIAPGTYTIQWVTVAGDGHRATGDYIFHVK